MKVQGAEQQDDGAAGGILALLADSSVALTAIPMPRIGQPPPRELRAYKWGDNPSTKGVFKLTTEGAAKIMAAAQLRGVVRCFDYFHATYDPNARPQDKRAAGHYRKELRAKTSDDPTLDTGGLFYVDIQWDPVAADEITRGCWPYISSAPVHDKDGVIVDDRNAALVTDPAMFGAASTLLTGAAGPSKGTPMADKKRLFMEAFAAGQSFMRKCQALAATDGAEKELGNASVGSLAGTMDKLAAYCSSAGYMGEMDTAAAQLSAGDQLLVTLSAECGESDLTKLGGVIQARLDGKTAAPAPAVKGVLLSDADAAKLTDQLLDLGSAKVPTVRRAALKTQGLVATATYLAAAQDITPTATPREAAPIAPIAANVEKTLQNAAPAPGPSAGKPTTYAELTAEQRAKVDTYVDTERSLMRGSAAFNEGTARESGMALLSDYTPPDGPVTRHMPPGGVNGRPPVEVR